MSLNSWSFADQAFEVTSFHDSEHDGWCYELYEVDPANTATDYIYVRIPDLQPAGGRSCPLPHDRSPSPRTATRSFPGQSCSTSSTPSRPAVTSSTIRTDQQPDQPARTGGGRGSAFQGSALAASAGHPGYAGRVDAHRPALDQRRALRHCRLCGPAPLGASVDRTASRYSLRYASRRQSGAAGGDSADGVFVVLLGEQADDLITRWRW